MSGSNDPQSQNNVPGSNASRFASAPNHGVTHQVLFKLSRESLPSHRPPFTHTEYTGTKGLPYHERTGDTKEVEVADSSTPTLSSYSKVEQRNLEKMRKDLAKGWDTLRGATPQKKEPKIPLLTRLKNDLAEAKKLFGEILDDYKYSVPEFFRTVSERVTRKVEDLKGAGIERGIGDQLIDEMNVHSGCSAQLFIDGKVTAITGKFTACSVRDGHVYIHIDGTSYHAAVVNKLVLTAKNSDNAK